MRSTSSTAPAAPSWSARRSKAEYLPGKGNPRFVVTSLDAEQWGAAALYEKLYCARGDMENRIKEQQLDLFADRTSTGTMLGNQLRLWLASVAYLLVAELRRTGLRGTELATAQAGTIRTRLLKIAARITLSVRRVVVSLSSVHPLQPVFAQALRNIQRRYPLTCRARVDPPSTALRGTAKRAVRGEGYQKRPCLDLTTTEVPCRTTALGQIGAREGPSRPSVTR